LAQGVGEVAGGALDAIAAVCNDSTSSGERETTPKERRPLALGDDLPHFQFLVQREFFGKL
jgi:hypothetical protein